MRHTSCDICSQPCEHVVAKLFLGPVTRGSAKAVHSNYTHHLDVGECCVERLMTSFKWRKRVSQKQYHKSRKENGGKVVEINAKAKKKEVTARPMRGTREGS